MYYQRKIKVYLHIFEVSITEKLEVIWEKEKGWEFRGRFLGDS